MTTDDGAARLSNDLTARWCAALVNRSQAASTGASDADAGFVVSGASTWPLLALLGSVADGPARDELCAATGVESADGQHAAVHLLATLDAAVSTSAALGLWAREHVPLNPSWVARLSADTVGKLTGDEVQDQRALDAWARRRTDGLIERMPITVSGDILLVLASALVARTRWLEPFDSSLLMPTAGPWAGQRGEGLSRVTHDLSLASILSDGATAVTRLIVTGKGDLDVHLLVGEGPAAGVLSAGVHALADATAVVPAASLPVGTDRSGLTVQRVESTDDRPWLSVKLPPFHLTSDHDLLRDAALFGLRAASSASNRAHFPFLSPQPLAVGQARSSVMARFSATGFEAAAVTAIGAPGGAGFASARHEVLEVQVTFDRPFGFLAVHRPTGLVVVAGWVASLPPAAPPPWADR